MRTFRPPVIRLLQSSRTSPGTLSPGCYNGLDLTNGTLTRKSPAAAVYIINGGTLQINAGANVIGNGVMFYLTNGANVQINGNATLDIKAATSGTYGGLLFYADRTDPWQDPTR